VDFLKHYFAAAAAPSTYRRSPGFFPPVPLPAGRGLRAMCVQACHSSATDWPHQTWTAAKQGNASRRLEPPCCCVRWKRG